MASIAHVTREDILAQLRRVDGMGEQAYLSLTGYGPSRLYRLRHQGKHYPSKAVLGAAAGLGHLDHSGGAQHTARTLTRLGFKIRVGKVAANHVCPKALAHARTAYQMWDGKLTGGAPSQSSYAPLAGYPEPDAIFASGANRPGEISGFGSVGHDVGVQAPEVREASEQRLLALAGTDVQVFCDNGAFSEVKFTAAGPTWPKPITDAQWDARLGLYRRLAVTLRSQLWIVAPDRVACQTTTLRRLSRYREHLGDLANLGARILVPIQKGEMSQLRFAQAVTDVLGPIRWTPSLPTVKSATTPEEAGAFMAGWRGSHVHFLGLGPGRGDFTQYADRIPARMSYSLDSVWIKSNVGWDKRRKGSAADRKPFRYTISKVIAKAILKFRNPGLAGQRLTDESTQLGLALCFTH